MKGRYHTKVFFKTGNSGVFGGLNGARPLCLFDSLCKPTTSRESLLPIQLCLPIFLSPHLSAINPLNLLHTTSNLGLLLSVIQAREVSNQLSVLYLIPSSNSLAYVKARTEQNSVIGVFHAQTYFKPTDLISLYFFTAPLPYPQFASRSPSTADCDY